MLLKIINIFCLVLAIGLSEADNLQCVKSIRKDYCQDYCANECKKVNVTEKDKKCEYYGSTVITDKYDIDIFYQEITLTWNTFPVNLTHLRKLNSINNKIKAYQMWIRYSADDMKERTFIRSIDYMKALNLNEIKIYKETAYETKDFDNSKKCLEFEESDVDLHSGPTQTTISQLAKENRSTLYNAYLSLRMEKLKTITFKGHLYNGHFKFNNNIFANNSQLESITFENLHLENLNAETFNNLSHLKELKFSLCKLENQNFFRSSALQNNLKKLWFLSEEKLNLTIFTKHKKLQKINFQNEDNSYYLDAIFNTNLTFFICNSYGYNCKLNKNICPEKCQCSIRNNDEFLINCDKQGNSKIPEIPLQNPTILSFQNNALTELPEFSSEKFDNLLELHLADNKLTNLSLKQLPKNLKQLDIRNNIITSLDSEVVEFLQNRSIIIQQSGINWISSCQNKKLINYLSYLETVENPVHYYHLNGPCPFPCTCCYNETELIINCTGTKYIDIPLPINVIGDYSLLLNDNDLVHLSQSLVESSNIRLLDIRNNSLRGLNEVETEFISQLSEVHLSGNPWECDCEYKKFLGYLRSRHPSEYKKTLRNCKWQGNWPEDCTICKYEWTHQFSINCNLRHLTELQSMPTMDNVIIRFEINNRNYLNVHKENAKTISFDGPSFLLNDDVFKSNTQLESIKFKNLNLSNIGKEAFENLTNLNEVEFHNCRNKNYEFLRSPVLQNNLKSLLFDSDEILDLTVLQNYLKLRQILVNYEDISKYFQAISQTNLTAYICDLSGQYCRFHIDTNGKRCPENCKCSVEEFVNKQTHINCAGQRKTIIPELPLPINGSAYLSFKSNDLTELPNFSSKEFKTVRRLYLAHNKLTNLSIKQLPENLETLDISYNGITSLDKEVVDFLRQRSITLIQTGLYWNCSCKDESLLNYLSNLENLNHYRKENIVRYHHLKGPCPEKCTCCVEENQFVINCTGKNLDTFPQLPNTIIGNTSLVLNDNRIEYLPNLRWIADEFAIRELHLKNNKLRVLYLKQLPSNLRFLDIQNNLLPALDDDVTEFVSHLPEFHLTGNPWYCRFGSSMFFDYLKREKSSEYEIAFKQCDSTNYMCCKYVAKYDVKDDAKDDVKDDVKQSSFPDNIFLVVFVFIIVLFVVLIGLRWHWEKKVSPRAIQNGK